MSLCAVRCLVSTFLENCNSWAKKFGEVRGPVRPFIFNLEVGWLTLSSFLKVSAAYMFWVDIWIQNQYWVQLMKNGLRGNLSKDFTKIIQTGENSDDETTGPVGCCKLKSYQVRSLCSRVAWECQDRLLQILEYYFPALNYRPVQENCDPNILHMQCGKIIF